MPSLNKCIFIGRIVDDLELKQTNEGIYVIKFSIAVSRRVPPKEKGEYPPSDFLRIIAWRKTAEFIARFFRKGDFISLVAEAQSASYTDSNGTRRYTTEFLVQEANFITPKGAPVPPDNIEPTPNPDFGAVPRYSKSSTPNFTETDGSDDDFPF